MLLSVSDYDSVEQEHVITIILINMVRNVMERVGGVQGRSPRGGVRGKAPAEGSGGCAPCISRNKFDWGNIIHFSQLYRGRKEQK